MIGDRIIEEKPVSLAEVKELIKKRNQESEPTYEQEATTKYAKKVAKLTMAKAKELIKGLQKIGFDEKLAIKIADLLPDEKEKLEIIIPKESELKEEQINQAMELLQKYIKKK
ncbi:MAG: DNA-directed RNA polymerase subunit F [Candidatus Diapherotrites archaeon]|nr:DNA-directed RNA polymerase subunit F [Candidatus Diapherotrites archaeon]